MKNKPNLFIIGASKCGTTSLWHMLNTHPEVYMSAVKEPWFFSFSTFKSKIDEYESLFANAVDEKYRGEASPVYSETTLLSEIPKRIYNYNADSKVIFIVREPISRLKSVWRQTLSSGHWHENKYKLYCDVKVPMMPKSFEKAVFNYPPFLEASKYWTHLNNYMKYFDKKNILLLFYEDLRDNPEGFYKETCNFLGIDYVINENTLKKQNSSIGKTVENPLAVKIRKIPFVVNSYRWISKITGIKLNTISKEIDYNINIDKDLVDKINQELKEETENILKFGGKPKAFWLK